MSFFFFFGLLIFTSLLLLCYRDDGRCSIGPMQRESMWLSKVERLDDIGKTGHANGGAELSLLESSLCCVGCALFLVLSFSSCVPGTERDRMGRCEDWMRNCVPRMDRVFVPQWVLRKKKLNHYATGPRQPLLTMTAAPYLFIFLFFIAGYRDIFPL